MASIPSIVARFKAEPHAFLTDRLILDAAAAAGHTWRERVLGPVITVRLLVLQMLHGNVSCRRLLRIAGLGCSVAAYINARARLPLDVLGMILSRVNDEARRTTHGFGRWLGHRVLLIDGSGVSMPDTEALRRAFGKPGRVREGCGFPVMHALWLFDAATGLLIDYVTGRWNRSDLADAAALHPMLEAGDVLVGDRAFGSFAHLALLMRDGLHGVMRVHHRRIVDFRSRRSRKRKSRRRGSRSRGRGAPRSSLIKRLGPRDQIVEWVKPKRKPDWMSEAQFAALPATLVVRELAYTIERPGYRTRTVTLVTTLVDEGKYPKAALAELYESRWWIETNLRHLKQTMGIEPLRCRSVEGVHKQLLACAIAYNLVRLRMLAEAARRGVAVERISFIDALDVLCHGGDRDGPATLLVNPHRPGRHEPRAIKRPRDRYPYMTRPRDALRQALGIARVAA